MPETTGHEARHTVHPDAPDPVQEVARAAAGFPWCDTCKAPAAFSEFAGVQHTQLGRSGTAVAGAPVDDAPDHEVTIRQWNATYDS